MLFLYIHVSILATTIRFLLQYKHISWTRGTDQLALYHLLHAIQILMPFQSISLIVSE